MMRQPVAYAALLLILFTCGCSTDSGPEAPSDGSTSGSESKNLENRDSMPGRWQLNVISKQASNSIPTMIPIALFEISEENGELVAKLDEAAENGPPLALKESEIADGQARLLLSAGGNRLEFNGVGDTKKLLGNITIDQVGAIPAQLSFSTALTIEPPAPLAAKDAFEDAMAEDDQIPAFREFARENPRNPLAREALEQCLNNPRIEELGRDEVLAIVDEYRQTTKVWGEQLKETTDLNAATALISQKFHLNVAREILENLEASLAQEEETEMSVICSTALKRLSLIEFMEMLEDPEAARQSEGVAGLQSLLAESPFESSALYQLGCYFRDHGQPDDAMTQFARIVATPELERQLVQQWSMSGEKNAPPSVELNKLWKARNETGEGLDGFVNDVYKDYVFRFVPDDFSVENHGSRSVLVELFTGALCPPCVAADMATGAVEMQYAGLPVTVLRYHQHIPGPDPLTSPDGEARFSFYQGQGTPTVLVNGNRVNASGSHIFSAASFANLVSEIKKASSVESNVKLDLSVESVEGVLTIQAGVPSDTQLPSGARLRLVIAEKEIVFPAPNGIRIHEMIVRSMPGGPAGIAVEDGQLSTSQTVKVEDLKNRQSAYLNTYESGRQWEFPLRPLDFNELAIVALVQVEGSKEILAVSRIDVEGLSTSSEETDAETEDSSKSPESGSKDESDQSDAAPDQSPGASGADSP